MIKTSRIVVQTVPWYNKAEFEEVYKGLFSKSIFDMRWAVDRITVWESRVHPVLDIGIDATASLVRAMIQDELFETNTSLCQPPDLILMYSHALIRFVNVVSEVARAKGSTAPVRVAARKLGIPEWIIHLRNNASHSRVPSISMLRSGCVMALDWLRTSYWDKELNKFGDYIKVEDMTDPKACETKANDIILDFQHCQFERLYKGKPQHMSDKKLNNVLKAMRSLLRSKPKIMLTELLRPGFFLPSIYDLRDILEARNEHSFIEQETIDLPSSLQGFWMPVIQLLMQENYIQEFTELLLQNQNNRSPLHQKVAACWVHKLIEDEESESLFGNELEAEVPSFNWLRLLGTCLEHCCMYTPALLPIIVDNINPPLSDEKKNFIMALVAVYLGATTSPNSSSKKSNKNWKTFTVDTVKEDLKLRDCEYRDENIFHQDPGDIDWASVPLGFVFGSETSFTLNAPPPLPISEHVSETVPNENATESEKQCLELKEESRTTNDEPNEIAETDSIDEIPLEYHPQGMQIY